MTRRRLLRPSWEALGLLAVGLGALWIVFGFADAFRFQLFYLFFLPVVWTAVRFGLEGVTAGLVLTQVGLITAIHFTEQDAAEVTAYQALMVVLSLPAWPSACSSASSSERSNNFGSIRKR